MSGARRHPFGWWKRVTLRDVLFFTLPPLALVLYLFVASVMDYHRIRQFDDWWSNATSVRKFGWYRVRSWLNSFETAQIDARLSAERADVPQLRLIVKRSDWDRIDSDVGAHWGEWIEVQILDQGDWNDARLRFRGDGSAHWSSEKKSFTLKTKSGQLYKGFRTMAFSVKDVLPQWLVGTMAKDFGLLAPEQRIVPVYLNDRFYGIHRFVEPIDESLLRRNLRMPGNVFRADTAERGDYFKGLPREVFANPYIWDRAANNDRPGAFGTSLLAQYLRDLNTSTFEEHERFMEWLDRDELSRLLAFLLVVGDPYHMSGVHNQFWYEDPTSGTLHPVVWDVRLLDLEHPPRDSNINRFWRAALKDPRVWEGTMRVLAEKLKDDSLVQQAEERVNGVWQRFHDEFAYDTLRSGVIPPVGDPQSTLAILRKNVETLRKWVADARSASLATAGVVDVEARGRVALSLTGFALDRGPEFNASTAPKLHVFADTNANGVRDEHDRELGGRGEADARSGKFLFRLDAAEAVLPAVGGERAALDPRPIAYRFFVEGADGVDLGPRPLLTNELTGSIVEPEALSPGAPIAANSSWHPWRYPKPAPAPVTLSGDVAMHEDLLIPERGSLRIEAGTTLTLDPDVSIESRGPVTASGTEAKPITIQRSNPDLPWGVIALQGTGAKDSLFEHVRFLGGGARQVGRVEYKGSVCAHNVPGVTFESCEFAYNSRCDDLINMVKSQANFVRCHFHHANADSIDYDMSGGLVAYNQIEGSGNDGLDLMTCWPRVIGNTIVNSDDKGISVGEDSEPFVFSNTIDGCDRGIEAKDRSAPLVLHTSITHCNRGIYAHVKNWRYGEPGWPKVVLSIVRDNKADYVVANDAKLTAEGALIGASPSDELPAAGDLEWLLRANGIELAPAPPGPCKEWKDVAPLEPIARGNFEEDFVDPRDGWTCDRGVEKLVKRKHDLMAHFTRDAGRIGHVCAWDLGDTSREYVLVLEIAGEEVRGATITAESRSGDASAPIELASDPKTYRYATLSLPPRAYDGMLLSATPTGPRARLALHGWKLFAWPKGGGK